MFHPTRDGAYGNPFHSRQTAAVVPRAERRRPLARQQLIGVAVMALAITAIVGLAAFAAQKYVVVEDDPTALTFVWP